MYTARDIEPSEVIVTLIFKRFLKSWADKVFKNILKRVGFFSAEIYDFSAARSHAKLIRGAVGAEKKWLVVVGRNHYFESTRDYPIGHMGDLKKLLKNEPWRFPYKGILINRIERLNQQAHRVTSWVIKNEVFDNLESRPLWVVPESVCVEPLAHDAVVELDRLGEKVYVSVSPDGLLSSRGQKESFLGRMGSTVASQQSVPSSIMKLAGSEAIESLLVGVMQALKNSPSCFYIGLDTQKPRSYALVRSLKLSAVIAVFYLAVTTGYLSIANSWVDYTLGVSSVRAESSLEARKIIRNYRREVEAFNQLVGDLPPLWIAWDVLLDLHGRDVSFRAINSSSNSVTYYLTAPKATDVLSWLSQDSRVAAAEFAVPVREQRGMEEFAIEVSFTTAFVSGGEDFADAK